MRPDSSTAFQGSVSSTCSMPSIATRKATFCVLPVVLVMVSFRSGRTVRRLVGASACNPACGRVIPVQRVPSARAVHAPTPAAPVQPPRARRPPVRARAGQKSRCSVSSIPRRAS